MGKTWEVIIVVIFINGYTYSQNHTLEQLNTEYKLGPDSIVEITDRSTGITKLKSIKSIGSKDDVVADLIIVMDTVNFSNYEHYYTTWGSLPLQNSYGRYKTYDSDNDGKLESAGGRINKVTPDSTSYNIVFYEHVEDSLFAYDTRIFRDSLYFCYDIGDITGDGLIDLIASGYGGVMNFFKQSDSSSQVNQFNFIFDPIIDNQANDVTFYDINNDGKQEIIYIYPSPDSQHSYCNQIAEYNSEINNYEIVYYDNRTPSIFTSGISIGDFDMDGKGNFATGGVGGEFFIYEHVQGDEYKLEYFEVLECGNAFLNTMTDDMDGNGKPEVWLGAEFSIGNLDFTKLYCYESTSSGSYKQVYQIEFRGRGLFSFMYGTLRNVDLDYDGKKELFVSSSDYVFGIKYSAEKKYYMDFAAVMPDYPGYDISNLTKVDAADIDGDGTAEIIPQYDVYENSTSDRLTRSLLLKRFLVTNVIDVEEPEYIDTYALAQNYPNPFNPTTTIRYQIPEDGMVTLKVYDILGREVSTLVNEFMSKGRYEAVFNAGSFASGMYIYEIRSGSFRSVKKMNLVK